MGFSSLKSNNPFRHKSDDDNVDDVAPPAGPPPSYAGAGSGSGRPGQGGDFAPPPGPPPSYGQQQQSSDDFAPPPGPPPSQHGKKTGGGDDYAPPPGPPPSQQQQQQPQHNWQDAVPDTSGFPPPPDIFSGWDRSQASNATEDQAEAGEAWCRRNPLSAPLNLDREPRLRRPGIVPQLVASPPGVFGGGSLTQSPSSSAGGGSWSLRSDRRGGDCCVVGYPHAYLVQRDSPLATGRPATVYFECYVREMRDGAGFALGFTALPYPPFRMPGWHRGSLAVHGDDGHRFVNDRWGGKDFTTPFKAGEVVGIGMTFSPGAGAGASSSSSGKGEKGRGGGGGGTVLETEIFFTRNGKIDGRWNLHESLDAETDLPVTGLEGYHDLAVTVGTFGQVGAEVVLDPSGWRYKPY